MAQVYRIIDLASLSIVLTGNELAEISDNGTNSYKVPIAIQAALRTPVTIATGGTYNLAASTYGDILVSTTSAVTVNLPDSTTRNGVPVSVVGATSSTPAITIVPNGAQNIIGQASVTIGNPWGALTVWPIQATGGGWYTK